MTRLAAPLSRADQGLLMGAHGLLLSLEKTTTHRVLQTTRRSRPKTLSANRSYSYSYTYLWGEMVEDTSNLPRLGIDDFYD